MKKSLMGICLAAVMACAIIFAPHLFSPAYANDQPAAMSEQVAPPVFVSTNFDTICVVDLSSKHEEDFLREERAAIDVITQSQRYLRDDGAVLLGMNDKLPLHMLRQQ